MMAVGLQDILHEQRSVTDVEPSHDSFVCYHHDRCTDLGQRVILRLYESTAPVREVERPALVLIRSHGTNLYRREFIDA